MNHLQGLYGRAHKMPLPDIPQAAQTVAHWLLTAPTYHPLWSQYVLACVRLQDNAPGFAPPRRKFQGATHEVLVVALDPECGPYDTDKILGYADAGNMPYLTPVNIAEQFIATDDEMGRLTELAAAGVVNGRLNPESADAPTRIREEWLTALTKTLAHIRGEVHAP